MQVASMINGYPRVFRGFPVRSIGCSLILAVALFPGPALAQEPPASVNEPGVKDAISPPEVLGAPLSEPPQLPATAIKQDADPVPPKESVLTGPGAGPITSSLPIWSGIAPLGEIGEPGNTLVGFGWWVTGNTGSPVKTGEYQGLSPSPFWVIDGLYSNGYQTLGIYGNQTDNESNQAALRYFSPRWHADIYFQRFIHRLDHIPLDNFLPDNAASAKLPNNTYVVGRDLNVGQDYAIRVEEFRSSVGSKINDNWRFQVDVWQQRKFGERQGNATAHCFQAQASNPGQRACHVLSQSQHIDWLTMEVTPRLEARFEPVTIEYSRPMRQFSQNDQMIFRDYQDRGGMINGNYPYAIVPDNLTQIDQLKASIDLGPHRQFYAFGYVGNTANQDRDVDRNFLGYDLRFTDWTLPRTSVTLYARSYNQTGELPTTLLTSETARGPLGQTQTLPATKPPTQLLEYIAFPLEYHRWTEGIKASWRPDIKGMFCDLAFTAGYEFDYLDRDNAVWQTPPRGPAAGQLEVSGQAVVRQANTTTQTLFAGVAKPWRYGDDSCVNTYARYKVLFVENPLFGVRQLNGVVNTNLPQQKHIVEFGGGWYPVSNFAITFQQDIEVGQNHFNNNAEATGNVVDFSEQAYNSTVTVWYAPTHKASLTASFSAFSNWINQNVFLGDNYFDSEAPPQPPSANLPLALQPTFYTGTSGLLNLCLNYKLTDNIQLNCGYQFVRGNNRFTMNATPSFAFPPSLSTNEPKGAITFTELPGFSPVQVETQRITAGVAWRPWPLLTVYLIYNYFDYHDETANYNSGTTHMMMAGLSRIW